MVRKDPGPRSMVRFIGRVIKGSKPGKHPGFVEPALATLRTKPPTGSGYVHEIKFDGYRVQAHLRGGLAQLYTRSGLNWTKRFPTIAVAASGLTKLQVRYWPKSATCCLKTGHWMCHDPVSPVGFPQGFPLAIVGAGDAPCMNRMVPRPSGFCCR
jgi:hypothetical protein